MLNIISRGFLLVCAFGPGVFLIVEFGLDPGFLTIFVSAVHAGYTPGRSSKHGMVGQMPPNRTSSTIFKAAPRLGLCNSASNRYGQNARQPQSYHAVQCHTLYLFFHIPNPPTLRAALYSPNPI